MAHIPAFTDPGLLVNIITLRKPCKLRILYNIKIITIKTLYNVCYTALFRDLGNLVENNGNTRFGENFPGVYVNIVTVMKSEHIKGLP